MILVLNKQSDERTDTGKSTTSLAEVVTLKFTQKFFSEISCLHSFVIRVSVTSQNKYAINMQKMSRP